MRLKMELHGTPTPEELASSVQVVKQEIKKKTEETLQVDKVFRGIVKDQNVNYQLECKNNSEKIEVCDFIALGEEQDPSMIDTPDPSAMPELDKQTPPTIRRIEVSDLRMEGGTAAGITRAYLVDNNESKRELVKITIKELDRVENKRNFLVNLGEIDEVSEVLGIKLIKAEDGAIKVIGKLKIVIE